MFTIQARASTFSEYTTHGVAWLLLRLGKGDPDVTFMPTVTRADGSPLSDEENADVDSFMVEIDYERITALAVDIPDDI